MHLSFDFTVLLFLGIAVVGFVVIICLNAYHVNDVDSRRLAYCMILVGLMTTIILNSIVSTKTTITIVKDKRVRRNYRVEAYDRDFVCVHVTDQTGHNQVVTATQVVHNNTDPAVQEMKTTVSKSALNNFLRSSHTNTETVINLPYER